MLSGVHKEERGVQLILWGGNACDRGRRGEILGHYELLLDAGLINREAASNVFIIGLVNCKMDSRG